MEQQSTHLTASRHIRSQEQSPTSAQLESTSRLSESVNSLRFPRPQGSQHLADWVSDSSPHIKSHQSVMSNHSRLADSVDFEMINSTDGESQDGQISESVGSLDYPRADDVHSLEGSSHGYRTDSEDEEVDNESEDRRSSASSIRYADQALQSPSTHGSSFRYKPAASPRPQSIEFPECQREIEEHDQLQKICVSHTISEVHKEDVAVIFGGLALEEYPTRVVATLRQTMTPAYLSTSVALRLLYVGSPAAYKDIVYKISQAILAAPSAGDSGKGGRRNTDAVFNIVPISFFGSTEVPEIELMESSNYQIHVEHCMSAEELPITGDSDRGGAVFQLTIDQNKTYRSVCSASGSIIEPKWTLPHVAIFFCSENDDDDAERTRDISWKFMSRHGVPSIFISNNQTFSTPPSGRWRDLIDEHAVHLCLESRDPDRPIPPQRLPIDLTSFLNIDARQMNRNLAFLTGLSDMPEEAPEEIESSSAKSTQVSEKTQDRAKLEHGIPEAWKTGDLTATAKAFVQRNRKQLWSLSMTLLGGVFGVMVAAWLQSSGLFTDQRAATPSAALSSMRSVVSTAAASTATTTIIINVTSTKTVNLRRPEASASPLASALSFAGLLADKVSTPSVSEPEPTNTVCSIERYGENELLIRIPTTKKSGWLAKGAIDIDVFRGEEPVKTKLSSVDEGIVVELTKKDAYGVLNISVVTTRKPKINETFEVNLGNTGVSEALEAAASLVLGLCDKAVNSGEKVLSSGADAVHQAAESLVNLVQTVEDGVRAVDDTILAAVAGAGQAAQGYSQRAFGEALQAPKHIAQTIHDAREQFSNRVAAVKANAQLTVLKAQIASKLWSLKIQGKTEEHDRYAKKAAEFLKQKHETLMRSLKLSGDEAKLKKDCGCTGSKRKTRHCPKKCGSASRVGPVKAGGRWKGVLGGG